MNRTYERTGFGGVFAVLVFACIVSTLLHGCGGSALQRQASAARVSRVALDITADGISTACTVDRVEMSSDPARMARRCLRAKEGHDLARAAWVTWVSAVVLAEDDEDALSAALAMAKPIACFYEQTAELLRALDVSAPSLPPAVLSFVGECEPEELDVAPLTAEAGASDAGVDGGVQ